MSSIITHLTPLRVKLLHPSDSKAFGVKIYVLLYAQRHQHSYSHELKDQRSEIRDRRSKIKDRKSKIENQKSKIKDRKSKIENQRSKVKEPSHTTRPAILSLSLISRLSSLISRLSPVVSHLEKFFEVDLQPLVRPVSLLEHRR